MTALTFDREQTEAIQALGTNVMVSASAGAGKTGVLVARFCKRVVMDQVPVSQILAVTFTEAAAAEMKKRLAKSLQEALLSETDAKKKTFLETQLMELDQAQICTIDSYCLSIIQKYSNVIGLDPARTKNILDESTTQQLQSKAFLESLQICYEKDPEAIVDCCQAYELSSGNYDSMQKNLWQLIHQANSQKDPDTWLDQARSSYVHVTHFQDFDPTMLEHFFQYWILEVSSFQTELNNCLNYAQSNGKNPIENIQRKLQYIDQCLEALHAKDYDTFVTNFIGNAQTPLETIKGDVSYNKSIRDTALKHQKKILERCYTSEQFVQDNNALTSRCQTLIDLAKVALASFQHLKEEAIAMDFEDMEHFAYQILTANDHETAHTIAGNLQEILVDEFQDTSMLQDAILTLVSNGKNMFRVGDVKQSIYRFRNAKPQQMRDMMKDPSQKQIALKHNYRSKESIVAFCNDLFQTIMNVEGCLDTYTGKDTVSIGSPERQGQDPLVPVRCVLLPTEVPDTSHEEDDEEDQTPINKEEFGPNEVRKAQWIASEIVRLKPGHHYKDFAVLVRSHSYQPALKRAFDACGIPYDFDAREGFYHSDLCQTILAICRSVLDPSDALSVLTVCLSSFWNCTDTQCAEMKCHGKNFLDGVHQLHPEFFEQLDMLHTIVQEKNIVEFLNAISQTNHFYSSLDDKSQSNFDYLFEKVTNNPSLSSLQDLITMMEASEEENSSEAISKGSDDDVVTVTTIHHSKGLQYPIVFVWGSNQNLFSDQKNMILSSSTGKIGLHMVSPLYRAKRVTLQRLAIQQECNQEDLEEFTRLLYVAFTRAEEQLILVDTAPKQITHETPTTLSTLQRRKGITGLVTSAIQEGPLFHIETGMEAPITPETPPAPIATPTIPSFDLEVETYYPIQTPSSSEVVHLPDLEVNQTSGGSNYGTLMHEAVASLPNTLWEKSDLPSEGYTQQMQDKLMEFGQSDLYKECLKKEIHKEFPFYCIDRENKQNLTGSMDFVAIGETDIVLIDFKTDAAEESILRERYGNQLALYKRALTILYPGKSITSYLWSFHSSKAIPMDVSMK